jgi:SAM-dependent methyltransferase
MSDEAGLSFMVQAAIASSSALRQAGWFLAEVCRLDVREVMRQTSAMSVTLINPANDRPLHRDGDALSDELGTRFPVVAGVPRICELSNYAENFGKQWNLFPLTQIDSDAQGQTLSRRRLFAATAWSPEQLDGLDILEVGSGAGRFTRVMLEHTRANIFSVDYSSAVEANLKSNGAIADGRLHLFQASIYQMPFAEGSFDKVFCFGVLQHTPSFEESIRALVQMAKRGGEIVVDFYPIKGWWSKITAKYMLRPILKNISHDRLLGLIERNVDWLIATHQTLTRIGLGALTRFLPIPDLRLLPASLSKAQLREWAVLDTFDMFSPEYDNPQRVGTVREMFERNGADVTFAGFIDSPKRSAVVRAIRT